MENRDFNRAGNRPETSIPRPAERIYIARDRPAQPPPPPPPHFQRAERVINVENLDRGRSQRTEKREHEKRRSTIIGEKEFIIKKKKGTETDRPNVSALANNSLETGDGLGDIEFLQNERRHRPERRYSRYSSRPTEAQYEFERPSSYVPYPRPPRPSSMPGPSGISGVSGPPRPSDEEIERRRRERWRLEHEYPVGGRPPPPAPAAAYMPVPPPGRYSPPPGFNIPPRPPPPRPPGVHSPISSSDSDSDSDSEATDHVHSVGSAAQPPRAAPRASIASRLPKRSKVEHKRVDLYFGMFIDGELKLSHKKHPIEYVTKSRDRYNDVWLIKKIKNEYGILKQKRAGRLSRWLWSLRTIGFASFKRWEKIQRGGTEGWFNTAQQGIFDYVDEKSSSRFQYRLKHPPKDNQSDGSRVWLARLDELAEQTDNECFFQVELFELPHTGRLYTLLFFAVLVSTGGGVAYAVVTKDVGTGLSLASFVITCIALALALLALGEFLGLERPDSFSFAYDEVDNTKVQEDTGKDARKESMRGGRREW